MPSSLAGVLIAILVVFPGLLGNWVYQNLVGTDWRQQQWQRVLRLLGFSVIGLLLYTIGAGLFGWPPPIHVFPQTYDELHPESQELSAVAFPYLGHLIGSFLAGFIGAWGAKGIAKIASSSVYPAAWDDFVRTCTPGRWVVAALKNEEVYAGRIRTADLAVATEERDVILEEPCRLEEGDRYTALNYQYLFIRADNLYSIAAVHKPELDKRTVSVGQSLFEEKLEASKTQEKTADAKRTAASSDTPAAEKG